MDIVTIVAANYLPYARVLASSVAENTTHKMWVLVLDATLSTEVQGIDASVLVPGDLDLSSDEFFRMASIYGVRELATAMKALALKHVLKIGSGKVCYLDPDIEVFSDLDEIDHILSTASVVLTPHRLSPAELDERLPNENQILLAGSYNLGFIGVAKRGAEMLDWWDRRLRRHAIDAPHLGYFTDQRWIDLVPSYFDCHLLKNPGYNVAYWNLDERSLSSVGERLVCNGEPLHFFHFSGFRPSRPWILCEYAEANPRYTVETESPIATLLSAYSQKVSEAGWSGKIEPDGFSKFPTGETINPLVRSVYRNAVLDRERKHLDPPPPAFNSSNFAELENWARTPIGPSSPVTRWSLEVWQNRADLQKAFPEPWWKDREGYAKWAQTTGVDEGWIPQKWALSSVPSDIDLFHELQLCPVTHEVLDRALSTGDDGSALLRRALALRSRDDVIQWMQEPLRENPIVNRWLMAVWRSRPDLQTAFPEPIGASATDLKRWWELRGAVEGYTELLKPVSNVSSISHPFGANISGYFKAELGVGEIGRVLIKGFEAAGIPFSTLLTDRTHNRQMVHFTEQDNGDYFFNVVAVNADQFSIWSSDHGAARLRDHYTIGVWAWEIEDFPAHSLPALDLVNEVWAISEFTANAIRKRASKPVMTLPISIEQRDISEVEPLNRSRFQLGDCPYVLFMFDYLSDFNRKNPLGVLEAFRKAKSTNDETQLVIKSINGGRRPEHAARLRYEVSRVPGAHYVDAYVDQGQRDSLLANCSAYISLHRAEGFGLTVAEAMAFGRPVIATDYSSTTEFLDESTGFPVTFDLVTIGESDSYDVASRWAEPDTDCAAEHLRTVLAGGKEVTIRVARARQRIAERHSSKRVGAFIMERLSGLSTYMSQASRRND